MPATVLVVALALSGCGGSATETRVVSSGPNEAETTSTSTTTELVPTTAAEPTTRVAVPPTTRVTVAPAGPPERVHRRVTTTVPTTTTTRPLACYVSFNVWGRTEFRAPIYLSVIARREDFAARAIAFALTYAGSASGPAALAGTQDSANRTQWYGGVVTLTEDMQGGTVTVQVRDAGAQTDQCFPKSYTIDFDDPNIVRSSGG